MPFLRVRFILLRAAVLIVAAWVTIVLTISGGYVRALTHPACARAEAVPAGFTPVALTTADGARLLGWWTVPSNGVAVVLQAGHGGSRDAMLDRARLLARHGYGALSLDTRSCAGQPATIGAREVEDLRAGTRFVLRQPGVRKVAVLGFSAGAVSAIRGAAEMPEISAVIAEGNYANMWTEIANSGAPLLSWEWQMERGTAVMLLLQVGVWPASISPIDELPRIAPRPVLLIHGEGEAENNQAARQQAAAGANCALWIVPGADHGGYLLTAPVEYERRVIDFLNALRIE